MDRSELHAFDGPEDVPGGYAILSDTPGIRPSSLSKTPRTCNRPSSPPTARPPIPPMRTTRTTTKLRAHRATSAQREPPRARLGQDEGACVLAESLGYEWLWVDTCCIERDTCLGLSVAFNGMYEDYVRSAVCLAYLAAFSPRNALDESCVEFEGEFCASRWHTRGWTLQELIPPSMVRFVVRDWTDLGSKHTLRVPLLESIIRIPASVLRGEREVDRCSIAQRMSRAAGRQTARLEDRAYSLIGILRINMSILQGEGFHAFARLEEEKRHLAVRVGPPSSLGGVLRRCSSWRPSTPGTLRVRSLSPTSVS